MKKRFESYIWIIVIVIACICFTNLWVSLLFIFFHELGHYAMGRFLGFRFKAASLLPFGMRFGFREEFINPWKDIIISMSGPLINFLFFILFLCLNKNNGSYTLLRDINLALLIFNMLPAAFLDGGRIFKTLISLNKGYYYGHFLANINGLILGVLLLVLTFANTMTLRKMPLLLMGIFFIYKSIEGTKFNTINVIKDILLRQNYNISNGTLSIVMKAYDENTKIFDIIKKFCFNKYYFIYIMDNGYLRYNINETDLIKLYCSHGNIHLKECVNYINLQEVHNGKNNG